MDSSHLISILDRFMKGELSNAEEMALLESLERCEREADESALPANLAQRKDILLHRLHQSVHQSSRSAARRPAWMENRVRTVANICFLLLFGASLYFYWRPAPLIHQCTKANLGSQADSSHFPMLAALVIHAEMEEGKDADADAADAIALASCVNATEEGYLKFESMNIDARDLINKALDAGQRQYLVFEDADMRRLLADLKRAYGVEFQFSGQLPEKQVTGFISRGLNLKMVVKLLASSGDFTASIHGKKVVLSARTTGVKTI
jgi:hypothetical protein